MRKRFGTARRTVGTLMLVSTAVAGVGLVAGCGTNTNSAGSTANGAAARVPDAAVPDSGSGAGGSGAGGGTSPKSATVAATQSLIIMAGLQLSVHDPAQAAAKAEQTVLASGGYVAAEAVGVGPQNPPAANAGADSSLADATGISPMTLPVPDAAAGSAQALLVLRVPPARLTEVLATLSGSGSVAYRTQSATDVTGQVADVDSRVASARASITELRGMIDKAASMNDLISLEQALASRESDLESLEAQQRALADQVAYATVTVGYFTPAATTTKAAAASHHRNPFAAGLTDSWHALIAIGRALLAVAGWLLPFAVLIALLFWPVRRLMRSRHRRRSTLRLDPDSRNVATEPLNP